MKISNLALSTKAKWLAGGLVATALAAVGVFLYATFRFPPDRASAWFTGEGLIVAIIALLFAGLAALFAFPAYSDWWKEQQRHPDIRIQIEVTAMARRDELQVVSEGATHEVPLTSGLGYGIFVRVAIINSGDAPVRDGILNIAIPVEL